MTRRVILVNRAPVLTLWAAVVAERLGFDRAAALTLGRAVAALNAQAKGRQLGIFRPRQAEKDTADQTRKPDEGEAFTVELLGRQVPVVNTEQGVRAADKGKPANSQSVSRYLAAKFGEDLPAVREAMESLAQSVEPTQLSARAYSLYEQFRPVVPPGKRGWGAPGELDLDLVVALGRPRA
jgi:hypothetical protein